MDCKGFSLTLTQNTLCTESPLSIFRRNWDFSHADPFAVIEVLLTSVKYAFYQTLGYTIFCALGYHHSATTIISAAFGGFIGGAIFTLPYLALLLPMGEDVHNDLGSPREQLLVLGTEMMYSAFAGGVGTIALDGWSSGGILMGMVRGLGGPFISFIFLFLSLKIILGSLWICKFGYSC